MTLQTLSSEKIYRPTKLGSSFTIFLAISMVLLAIANSIFLLVSPPTSSVGRIVSICTIVLFPCLAWLNLYDVKHNRLVISPQGVEYHSRFSSVYETWENVGIIGLKGNNPCLTLRQPTVKVKKWLKWFSLSTNLISLSTYGNWRKNGLEQDLKHYAPHIFKSATDSL